MCSGCGCKEVYRFPHITYPYSSCIYPFLQQHPYFLIFLKCFSLFYIYMHINFFYCSFAIIRGSGNKFTLVRQVYRAHCFRCVMLLREIFLS